MGPPALKSAKGMVILTLVYVLACDQPSAAGLWFANPKGVGPVTLKMVAACAVTLDASRAVSAAAFKNLFEIIWFSLTFLFVKSYACDFWVSTDIYRDIGDRLGSINHVLVVSIASHRRPAWQYRPASLIVALV